MACKFYDQCTEMYKDEYCKTEPEYENKDCCSYIRKENELLKRVKSNPYWENACIISDKQRQKDIDTYGQWPEGNIWNIEKRLQYLEEELVDALMYIEWIKEGLRERKGENEL